MLFECCIERILAETVHEFDKVVSKQVKVLSDRQFECPERLLNEHFLCVLRSQSEYVDDYAPSRLDVNRLLTTDACDTHHDVLLYVSAGHQIVQHYCLKGFQEVLLEAELLEFFLEQKLIRQCLV